MTADIYERVYLGGFVLLMILGLGDWVSARWLAAVLLLWTVATAAWAMVERDVENDDDR